MTNINWLIDVIDPTFRTGEIRKKPKYDANQLHETFGLNCLPVSEA